MVTSTEAPAPISDGTQNSPANHGPLVHVLALLLGAAAIAMFGQTFHFGFLDFDDGEYLNSTPEVAAGLSFKGVWWAFTNGHVGQWHPLTTLSFMLDVTLYGPNGGGYHLTNVLLHACATMLLFYALRQLTGSLWRSAMVTAIFALHPLRAESVSWIAERKDVLSGVFMMATLWAYAKAVRRDRTKPRLLVAIVFFALGLMSKPMLVTLPVVMLLLDFWPLRRMPPDTAEGSSDLGERIGKLVREKLPMFALSLIASIIAVKMQAKEYHYPIAPLKLAERLSYIPVSYVSYLIKMVWPFGLSAHYPYRAEGPEAWQIIGSIFVLCALTVCAVSLVRRVPTLFVGWFWFVIMLMPVIGIFFSGIQVWSDRYTYVTQIGLTTAVVWIVAGWAAGRISAKWQAATAGAALLAMTCVCWAQVQHWKNDYELWTHAVKVTKDNAYAHSKLGRACQGLSRLDEAEINYREAIKLDGNMVESLNNLSNIVQMRGDYDEALKLQQRAVELHPKWNTMHHNLAQVFNAMGRIDDAKRAYNKAIELEPKGLLSYLAFAAMLSEKVGGQAGMEEAIATLQKATQRIPDAAEAWFSMGNIHFRMNREREALADFKKALELEPKHAQAANNLGALVSRSGDTDGAIPFFRTAIQNNPGLMDAYYNLAESLAKKGAIQDVVGVWRSALQRDPNNVRCLSSLAWILATSPADIVRSGSQAVQLAARAVQLTAAKDATVLDVLAAALAEAGRFQEAEQIAQKALDLPDVRPNSDVAKKIKEHMEAYKNRRALRSAM